MKNFPSGKRATELGMKLGDKFIFRINSNEHYSWLEDGDEVLFIEDDNSRCPGFKNVKTSRKDFIMICDLYRGMSFLNNFLYD